MVNGYNSLYKDYENLLIKNDKLSKENRNLRYMNALQESQIKTFMKREEETKSELLEKQNKIEANIPYIFFIQNSFLFSKRSITH